MLLGTISTNVVTSGALFQSTVSVITTPGIPMYWFLVIIALISLLSLKEVLSSSKAWNKHLNDSFNIATIPLLFCFTVIVAFKVTQII